MTKLTQAEKYNSKTMYDAISVMVGKFDIEPNSIERHDRIVAEIYRLMNEERTHYLIN